MAFQGFALCVRMCRALSRERSLGYSPPPPNRACLMAGWKAANTKSPPLAVKKVRLAPVQKVISLFSYRHVSIRWNNTSNCFLPPTADFLNGQRPLFLPWLLLSPCSAWRWGWRWWQGGKLVFRLASLPSSKRRSRQQPSWLFVFISSYIISCCR